MTRSDAGAQAGRIQIFDPGFAKKRLASQLAWFSLWFGVTAVGLCLHPSSEHHGTHTQLGLPPCPSVILFGRPCPGCGLTTSWTALLHGDLNASIQAHALGPVLYLGFTATALLCAYGYAKGLRLRSDSRPANIGLVVTLIAMLAYGGIRFATVKYPDAWRLWSGKQGWKSARVPEKNLAGQLSRSGHAE
ncbi:MAG: DUF2752 domain-containing protein [Armatimonadetes bacterium]|nr:DUF2752 domain-containing protein [Armatimonadota bacterium]